MSHSEKPKKSDELSQEDLEGVAGGIIVVDGLPELGNGLAGDVSQTEIKSPRDAGMGLPTGKR